MSAAASGRGGGTGQRQWAASAIYGVRCEPPVSQTLVMLRGGAPALLTFSCQTYFEDNPRDLQLLRHDLPLHPAVVKPHLGHVPDYLGERACGPWVLGAVPQTGPWRPGGSSAQAHTSARRGPQMLPSGLERGGAHLGHTRSHLPVACG